MGHFGAKSGQEGADRCKPNFNTVWERHRAVVICKRNCAIWAQCMKCISFTFTQKTAPTNPSWVTPGKLDQLVDWQAHTHTSISALQPISVDTINILDKAGSRGNSSMLRPSGVSDPVLSSAPRTHSWYMEFIILSFTHNHTSNSHSLYNCST